MSKKTPLELVTKNHGSKEKLVDKLVGMVDRGDEDKDEFRSRLTSMANSKLLRLYEAHATLKDKFGSKDKLVGSLLELMKREKDEDYAVKLASHTPVRLLAMHSDWAKKSRRAARKGDGARA